MFGYATKYLQELADSVLKPIWAWVLARSWWVRALILLLALAVGYLGLNRDVASEWVHYGEHAIRVASAKDRIPLNPNVVKQNQRTISRLAKTVSYDLESLDTQTPWSVSQAALALKEARQPQPNPELPAFIMSGKLKTCLCWKELSGDPDQAVYNFIAGWTMAALADAHVQLPASEYSTLLQGQDQQGWWPVFPDGDRRAASTYATAWIVFGLISQKRAGLVPKESQLDMDRAIRRGLLWLSMTRHGSSRWSAYPNLDQKKESDSISGLVVHVLHQANPDELEEVDEDWLDNLPDAANVDASTIEPAYVEIATRNGVRIDHLAQVPTPWLIVATVDAYRNGSIKEKARALHWLEVVLSSKSVRTADANSNSWWRAELLYALAYAQRNIGAEKAAS